MVDVFIDRNLERCPAGHAEQTVMPWRPQLTVDHGKYIETDALGDVAGMIEKYGILRAPVGRFESCLNQVTPVKILGGGSRCLTPEYVGTELMIMLSPSRS